MFLYWCMSAIAETSEDNYFLGPGERFNFYT